MACRVPTRRTFWLMLFFGWFMPMTTWAVSWAEPTCDPAVDPTDCNISAPINVSASNQTKTGGLELDGALITNSTITANGSITAGGTVTVNSTGSLTVNGNSTLGTSTSGTLTVYGTGSIFNSLVIFNNGMDVATKFNYTGAAGSFTLTADSINDSEVSNTLTASIFRGSGSTSDAVDLGNGTTTTGEVAGILPSTSVSDAWVNNTGDNMSGALTTTSSIAVAPSTALRGITITPYSTQEAIYISGGTSQPLVSLGPTGSGGGVSINISSASTSRGLAITSATGTAAAYPIDVDSTSGSPTYSIRSRNQTTGGYGVYSVGSGTSGIGVGGAGTGYGVYGTSSGGTGGYFASNATGGTGLYATLSNTATTTSSKALEVVGKNGYGGYITVDGSSATGLYVENTNTNGTYSVGYFKANGASTSGGTTTALYAENTSTASSTTKYAIQAKATSLGGEGIYAVSDYGQAGHFESDFGKGIYVDVSGGGTYGIDIDAPGTSAGINIAVDDGEVALNANNGEIKAVGGFRGGQFYANENAGNGIYQNVDPNYVFAEALGGSSSDAVTDLLFDGSSVWVARGGFTPSYLQQRGLSDGRKLAEYTNSASWLDNGLTLLVDDSIYFFSDSADYDVINRLDGTTTAGSLSSSITIYSTAYDGTNVWFGTSSRVYEWDLTTLSARVLGLGNIRDMVYADGYIWAVDYSNDAVKKVDTDSYSSSTITVGDGPTAAVYDGQYIWVANYIGNSLTRINTEDSSTTSYSVSSFGTGPQTLTFDGANIWIGYNNSGVGVFNVATESLTKENDMAGAEVEHLAFDGTYIWVVTNDQYLFKIPSGFGFGETSGGITDGILMYNTSGSVRCLYVSGSTVTASSTLTNCQ